VRARLRSRVNTARCSAIPDFIAPERIAEIILFCYKLPQSICIRDLVVMPTTSGY
jgi:NADP-dependent 3-hydroxy acid dehydrogenase YdfG